MTAKQIIEALGQAHGVPKDALRDGVAHADTLAPSVMALADKFCDGVHLLPHDEQVLFYGLHILAAARKPGLYPMLWKLAQLPDLEQLFGDHDIYALTRLLLSTYDVDEASLFAALESRATPDSSRWALFGVLTRLTWEGRIPRERTVNFVKRFEQEPLADEDDMVWHGWEDAVILLGLEDLEPILKRVWNKETFRYHKDIDKREALEVLRAAIANPEDEKPFIEDGLIAIDDPVKALQWVERMAELTDEDSAEIQDDEDPARDIRLSTEELDWLAGFLSSQQIPDTSMNLEMLDGYFTALVIGPETVMPSEYMPEIWGEDGESANYDSVEQAEYVMGLMMRHWNTIAQRISEGYPHMPIMVPYGDADRGRDWARGFTIGTALRSDAWTPLIMDKKLKTLVPSIMALIRDDEMFEDRITPDLRAEILESLPVMVQTIALYWRDPTRLPKHRQSVRSTKVGRNQPCPCGSGKKFKRCCGSTVPPTVH